MNVVADLTPDQQSLLDRELQRLSAPAESELFREIRSEQDAYLDENYPGWRERG